MPSDDEIVDVFIEIPKGSRNKYEFDHEKNIMRLDRRLFSAMAYPADYGFVIDTLGEDGDSLDALVLVDDPTFPGCVITARPLGVFWMEDEKGKDAKIICVVAKDPVYERVEDLEHLPGSLLSEIEHFFDVYKMLEPNKSTSTLGYEGRSVGAGEIRRARQRLRELNR